MEREGPTETRHPHHEAQRTARSRREHLRRTHDWVTKAGIVLVAVAIGLAVQIARIATGPRDWLAAGLEALAMFTVMFLLFWFDARRINRDQPRLQLGRLTRLVTTFAILAAFSIGTEYVGGVAALGFALGGILGAVVGIAGVRRAHADAADRTLGR